MTVPDFLRDQMDESGALENRALSTRFAAEEAINAAGPQVGDIFALRDNAIFDVVIGIKPMRGKVIAQLQG